MQVITIPQHETKNTYIYQDDFDKNGFFYALGTDFSDQTYLNPVKRNELEVECSEIDTGNKCDFIDWEPHTTYTKNKEPSYFSVTIKNYMVTPTHYTLRNTKDNNTYALRSWNFEASHDKKEWTVLTEHKNDDNLRSKSSAHTWEIPNKDNKLDSYKHFRVNMTNSNAKSEWALCCGGMEIYGNIYSDFKHLFHDRISLNDDNVIELKHDKSMDLYKDTILNSKLMIQSGNKQQIVGHSMSNSVSCKMLEFNSDKIEDMQFLLPFSMYKDIYDKDNYFGIYVQSDNNTDFVVFKAFKIKNNNYIKDTKECKIDYLFNVLLITKNEHLKDLKSFYKEIGFVVDTSWIKVLKYKICEVNNEANRLKILDKLIGKMKFTELEIVNEILSPRLELLNATQASFNYCSYKIKIDDKYLKDDNKLKYFKDSKYRVFVKDASFFKAENADDGDTKKQFKYVSDFDENGFIYGLGTEFGKKSWTNPVKSGLISVDNTSMYRGEPYQFLGRKDTETATNDESGSFFNFDIGEKFRFRPTHYTLRNWDMEYHMKNWEFSGSVDRKSWVQLKKHSGDTDLKGKFNTHTWELDKNLKYFRYFKIQTTGANSYGNNKLYCAGFEMYGFLGGKGAKDLKNLNKDTGKKKFKKQKQRFFDFKSNFDENGIIYAIGTDFGAKSFSNPAETGKIKLKSTKMYSDYKAYNLISRDTSGTMTDDAPDKKAFMSIDLVDYKFKPSHYSIRNCSSSDAIKAWNFEGSMDGKSWVILRSHVNDTSLKGSSTEKTWQLSLDKDKNKFYQHFRICCTDDNTYGSQKLYMSGFEIYGELFSPADEYYQVYHYVSDNDVGVIKYNTDDRSKANIYYKSLSSDYAKIKTLNGITVRQHGATKLVEICMDDLQKDWTIYQDKIAKEKKAALDALDNPDDDDDDDKDDKDDDSAYYQIYHHKSDHVEKYNTTDKKEADEYYKKISSDYAKVFVKNGEKTDEYGSTSWVKVCFDEAKKDYEEYIENKDKDEKEEVKKVDLRELGKGDNFISFDSDDPVLLQIKCTYAVFMYNEHIHSNYILLQEITTEAVEATQAFTYQSDFDKNGFIYALGTDFGALKEFKNPHESGACTVKWSDKGTGSVEYIVGRDDKTAYSKNKEPSWISIDLKKYKIRLTRYTLKNTASDAKYHLKSWKLEGSNDDKNWDSIRKHSDDMSLEGKSTTKTWEVDTTESYQFFRIYMVEKNNGGDWCANCSGWEMYGDVKKVRDENIFWNSLDLDDNNVVVNIDEEVKFNNKDKNSLLTGKYIILNDDKLEIKKYLVDDNLTFQRNPKWKDSLKIGDKVYVFYDIDDDWHEGEIIQINKSMYRPSLNTGSYGSYTYKNPDKKETILLIQTDTHGFVNVNISCGDFAKLDDAQTLQFIVPFIPNFKKPKQKQPDDKKDDKKDDKSTDKDKKKDDVKQQDDNKDDKKDDKKSKDDDADDKDKIKKNTFSLYVLPKDGTHYMLIKTFQINNYKYNIDDNPNEDENKVNYLLDALSMYNWDISNKEAFYQKIGFEITNAMIPFMKNKLVAMDNYESRDKILNKLWNELKISGVEQIAKAFLGKYKCAAVHNIFDYASWLMNGLDKDHDPKFYINNKYKVILNNDEEDDEIIEQILSIDPDDPDADDKDKVDDDDDAKKDDDKDKKKKKQDDTDILYKYTDELSLKLNKSYLIFIENDKVFGTQNKKYIYLQNSDVSGDEIEFTAKKGEFVYASDFDENGLLFAIGTDFGKNSYENPAKSGKIKMKNTPMYSDYKAYEMVGREKGGAMTDDDTSLNAFFSIDLVDYKLKPTHYSLRNCSSSDAIKSWQFSGSNDDTTWIILKEHVNDLVLKGASTEKTWELTLTQKNNKAYRYFRIMCTDENTYPSKKLYCSGFELYGDLYGKNDVDIADDAESKCGFELIDNKLIKLDLPKDVLNVNSIVRQILNAKYLLRIIPDNGIDLYDPNLDENNINNHDNKDNDDDDDDDDGKPKDIVGVYQCDYVHNFAIPVPTLKKKKKPNDDNKDADASDVSDIDVDVDDDDANDDDNDNKDDDQKQNKNVSYQLWVSPSHGGDGNQDDNNQSMNYQYRHDFDENGLLFALGTNFKTTPYVNPAISGNVVVTTSKSNPMINPSYGFIGRTEKLTSTENESPSFFYVDIGKYRLKPDYYTLRHYNPESENYYLQNWNFEASINGKDWFVLRKHKKDHSLKGKSKVKSWEITEEIDYDGDGVADFFSHFRVVMTKPIDDYWNLPCSGLEIYGECYQYITEHYKWTKFTVFNTK